jgi:DNA-binding LacI/PurR family transcriptional regulator
MTSKLQEIADSAVKYNLIADELRRQIVSNSLPPGSQLPTRLELGQHYQVSSVTVQKALDCLIQDGFVDATRRKGSFVVDRPPHLFRYGLVFHTYLPNSGHTSRYLTAMANEALRIQRSSDREVVAYYSIDIHADTPDFQRLVYDLRAHRLAGLIFPFGPEPEILKRLLPPSLEHAIGAASVLHGVGAVAVSASPEAHGLCSIDLDAHSFIDKALDYLRARGRRRVAVLSGITSPSEFHRNMAAGIAARGMTTRPYWTQRASISEPETARNCAHLLMMPVLDAGEAQRPDGLIVTDDNLVEHASIGLIASGVRVGDEADVVVHCNFPWPMPSVVPVKRLGYDIRQLLEVCIASIDRYRRGDRPPEFTSLPALFEDEVAYQQAPEGLGHLVARR